MSEQHENNVKLAMGCLMVILTPFVFLYSGFIFHLLWLWFMVPLGLNAIGIAHAIGIVSIAQYTTMHLQKQKIVESGASTAQVFGAFLGYTILGPAIFLLVGWICTFFM